MEFFHKAKSVRFKSSHNKYLVAHADKEMVRQDEDGSGKAASWTVEISDDGSCIRLKSCFDMYLTASEKPSPLGLSGKKVIQTFLLDDSSCWKPIEDGGSKVRLETSNQRFLRGNGGFPPWKDVATHAKTFMRHETSWEVDVLELQVTPKSTLPLLPDSIPNRLDEIRQVALAFYAHCCNDDKSAAVKMFRKADSDGNGDLSYEEFHAACLQLKCPENFLQETFHDLDLNKDGVLDFQEAVPFYYMLVIRMIFCESCKQYLYKSYFTCSICFNRKKEPEIFSVCLGCYKENRFQHEHDAEVFMDNQALIRVALKKGTTSGGGEWLWRVAGFGVNMAVSGGMCDIM